jgi:hypothetical protein
VNIARRGDLYLSMEGIINFGMVPQNCLQRFAIFPHYSNKWKTSRPQRRATVQGQQNQTFNSGENP